jgi:hypothetical protein
VLKKIKNDISERVFILEAVHIRYKKIDNFVMISKSKNAFVKKFPIKVQMKTCFKEKV